jgi:amino-acid N-acetyltransferase
MSVIFRQYQSSDQKAVKALIQAGLVEHWKILDPEKNPDLNDIQKNYANAIFLVAQEDNLIVGCGALIPRSNKTAEIVRMSVTKSRRMQGVGTQILNELKLKAREMGIQAIYLETTATWEEVIAFYLRNGFRITHYQDEDVYFALDL